MKNTQTREPIAITGIGCRFPGGVTNPKEYWNLMLEGVDAISEIPEDRWSVDRFYSPDPKPGKSYTKWGGFLSQIDQFDAGYFGIPDDEAKAMDPQQRLLLETSREAMDEAGHQFSESHTGVFVGTSTRDYELIQCPATPNQFVGQYNATGTSASCIVANRLSYNYNLTGPSVSVDTACSSSLIAVHFACESIWNGNCTSALAAGVNLIVLPTTFAAFSTMKMLSPEGRCKAFDEAANGFVRGEGAGVIYLRPLSEALANGDLIYATILATGSNQDGKTSGMTLPNPISQASLIEQVCAQGNVDPGDVDYMEAHGTGTLAGDEAETKALGQTMGHGRLNGHKLPIGSVKTNIGHLESGAGIAGIIKAAMVLKKQQITGNLHFNKPNPSIDFDKLGLRVPVKTESLSKQKEAHLAGVNSFGFGGTNAFALLQSYPNFIGKKRKSAPDAGPMFLPLSSKSTDGLKATAENYANHIKDGGSLKDIAFTSATRRSHFTHRLAAIGRNTEEMVQSLLDFSEGEPASGIEFSETIETELPEGPVFVFSGQGPQWWAMGQEMMAAEPLFREAIMDCSKSMDKLKPDWSLWDELNVEDHSTSRMEDTAISQPAIFAIQVSVARVFAHWGIKPAAVVGHSVGEVAAAHIAGVYDLDDAMKVIYNRGRTMSEAKEGSMLAAALDKEQALALVEQQGGSLSLAAVNAPNSVTIAGAPDEIKALQPILDERQTWNREVPVKYAFHSGLMDPVKQPLLDALVGLEGKESQIPIYSTVTGDLIEGAEMNADYWWQNVRLPVLFSPAIEKISEQEEAEVFVEVAPHPALARSLAECAPTAHVVTTLRRNPDLFPERVEEESGDTLEPESMMLALGKLFSLGWDVKWENLACLEGGQTTALPAYAWQRKRYWLEDSASRSNRLKDQPHPFLLRKQDVKEPTWHCSAELRLFPYLGDHVVQKHTLFPAAGFIEVALAAGAESLGVDSLCLEDFEIEKALILSSVDGRVTEIEAKCQPGNYFVCNSRPENGSESWTQHARCAVREIHTVNETPVNLEGLRKGWHPVAVPEFYESLRELDYHFGPTFQSLKQIWTDTQESMGQAILHENLVADSEKYHLHPVLLDACLQLVGAIFAGSKEGNKSYLPVGFQQIRMYKSIGSEVWGHAKLLLRTETGALANVTLLDADGTPMAEIIGFRLQLAPGSDNENSLFYGYDWETKELEEKKEEAPVQDETEDAWLILGSERDALAEALGAKGKNVISSEELEAGHKTIIYVAGESEEIESEPLEVLSLVQQLAEAEPNGGVNLSIVTRSGFDTGIDGDMINLDHAPLTGLRRVIYNENKNWNCRLIDWSESSDLDALVEELLVAKPEDEVALRGEQRLVPRLDSIQPKDWDWAGEGTPEELPSRWMPGDVKSFDQLQMVTIDRRDPGENEIEVEVVTAGLNFRDVMKALGMYPGDAADANFLGDEFAGKVISAGKNVTKYKAGDRVVGIFPGALTTHLTVHQGMVIPIPEHLNYEEAVTFPESFLTAGHSLCDLANIQKGERVLIHSATGGVGLAAVQFALREGCEVFGTAGNPEKRAYLKELGVHHVLDSRSLSFADEIREITNGEGIDVVLNSLAGEAMIRSMELLRVDGRFLELGKRDIYGGTAISLMPFRNSLTYYAIDLGRRMNPEQLGKMLGDLSVLIEDKELSPLPRTKFSFGEAQEGFRYMAQGKHIGKNVFTLEDAIVKPRKPAPEGRYDVNSDGTYLITGGLKGLGLALAEQLVERGGKHLMLTSRSGAISEEAQETIDSLKAAGVTVVTKSSDSASEKDVDALFAEISKDMPPLRGIIHAATVYQDAMLTNQDEDSFKLSIGPKAKGAWLLHERTIDNDKLDFFVTLSSVSATVGNPGQGNYVTANTYCDALAQYRKRKGLPAVSVALESVVDAGYAARNEKVAEHLSRMQMKGISSTQIMEGLDSLLTRDEQPASVVMMTSGGWIGVGAKLGMLRNADRYERMITDDGEDDGQADLRETLLLAPSAERSKILLAFLQRLIGEILRVPPARLPLDKAINEIGLDSLMMVEFATKVETKLGGGVQLASLTDPPTIRELTNLILTQIFGEVIEDAPKKADAEEDCLLGGDIEIVDQPWDKSQITAPKTILLTGATGFLGAHLLVELFNQFESHMVCLVRADDEKAGMERVLNNLKKYNLTLTDSQLAKLEVLAGDVADPNMGLSDEVYERLSVEVDTIYHCAALVNFFLSYDKLRKANVVGTLEVMKFAGANRLKPVHHMSTLAVFSSEEINSDTIITEENRPFHPAGSGYGESKRVTETIISNLTARGLPVSVYRTGFVMGSGLHGESNGDEIYWRIIRSAIVLGAAPDSDCELHLSRVETVAKSLALISRDVNRFGGTYHLLGEDRLTLGDFIDVAVKRGYEVEKMDASEWIGTLRDAAGMFKDDSLSIFAKVYSMADIGIPELLGREQVVSSKSTDRHLHEYGISHEPINEKVINRFLDHFIEKELI